MLVFSLPSLATQPKIPCFEKMLSSVTSDNKMYIRFTKRTSVTNTNYLSKGLILLTFQR